MNDKRPKKDISTIFCSINENDIKNFVEPVTTKSKVSDKGEKQTRSSSHKIDKKIDSPDKKMHIPQDLKNKAEEGLMNISFSPLKSTSITNQKGSKTRNCSEHPYFYPKTKKLDNNNTTSLANKISGISTTKNGIPSAKLNNSKIGKSEKILIDSNTATPATLKIILPGELNFINDMPKSRDQKPLNVSSTASTKISGITRNSNKKSSESGESVALGETERLILNNFKSTLNEIINKNSSNLFLLKEIEAYSQKVLSEAINKHKTYTLTVDDTDGNRKNHKNSVEKKKDSLKPIKTTNYEFKLINPLKINPKVGAKSKSLLSGSSKHKRKQNISLFKFDDRIENQKSPFKNENKSALLKYTASKISQQTISISDSLYVQDDMKLSPNKRTNKHHNTLNAKENNVKILDESVNSAGSEYSMDNLLEGNTNQANTKSQPKNLPKLDFKKGSIDLSYKYEQNKANISGKPENRSDNTSAFTPDTKGTKLKDKMALRINFSQNQNGKGSQENQKSNSTLLNQNGIGENLSTLKEHNDKSKSFLLNLENLPKIDYNTEFLSKYEEFSPSWREGVRKVKGLRIEKEEVELIKLETGENE